MTAVARELFEQLRAMILEMDSGIIELAESRSVSYHGPAFFLEVLPRKNRINLLLALDFAANAIRTVRADRPDAAPTDRVVGLSPLQIQRRFTAAARAAGIEARVTAHSGRVGLASELTARGASTTEVMLAGNWKTAPARNPMLAEHPDIALARDGLLRRLRNVVRVRLTSPCR